MPSIKERKEKKEKKRKNVYLHLFKRHRCMVSLTRYKHAATGYQPFNFGRFAGFRGNHKLAYKRLFSFFTCRPIIQLNNLIVKGGRFSLVQRLLIICRRCSLCVSRRLSSLFFTL